ncbi:hypothetical protein GMA11_08830, partial [Granulicatella sp. zg-ZJ]|uniref:transposase n=1 Tax=Granulicatella sp. zg-ZJ TaxID=2678504 RepID=UPI0013FBA4E5|nr:hypothetical protein [Granulicatella sp. zg-ZJ]
YRRFHRNPDHKFFRYDSSRDCFTDTRTGEIYTYRNIDRQGYKQYRISDNSNKRILRRAIDADVYDRCRERRLSTFGKALYKRRKETIERSFADSKQNHGYRFAQYSSLFIIFKCKIQHIFQFLKNMLDFLSLLSTI